jgi:hypothetical protein
VAGEAVPFSVGYKAVFRSRLILLGKRRNWGWDLA